MANLRILVPEGTTNYVTNPSIKVDTSGWNSVGSTLSRVLTRARFGMASLQVITNGSAIHEGTFFRVSSLSGISDAITISAYVCGTGHVRIRLVDGLYGNEWFSQDVDLEADRWTRLSVMGRSSGSNDMRLYVETHAYTGQAVTFYVDGGQLERKPYPTSYCDGSMPGCRWTGLFDGSTSYRDPYTREGGRWVTISGAEREREDIYVTTTTGLGVSPIANNRQSYALAPGGFLDNVKIVERSLSLTFNVKHKGMARTCKQARTLENLHELRQMLIDLVKPDKTGGNQPLWLEYQDGDIPLYLQVYYDGGLEGDWDVRNQWHMEFTLNLLALSPMFIEDNQYNAQLDFQDNHTGGILPGRIDGIWTVSSVSSDDGVRRIAYGSRGEIYWGGTQFGYIGYLNNLGVNSLIGTANGAVYDCTVAQDGTLYIVGNFTSVSGVAANYIAKWNGTIWSALGTGLNGIGWCVKAAPNGDVYVGGAFTTAGGKNCRKIAKWDRIDWQIIGTLGGLNDTVNDIEITDDGTTVYFGGIFTDQYGLSANALLRVTKYTISTNAFTAMGDGLNNTVQALALSDMGVLYAGGAFTQSGIATMARVGKFNGTMWEQLGNGFSNGIVYDLAIGKNYELYAVGSFTLANGITTNKAATWNGSSWANIDANLNYGYSVMATPYGDVFIGMEAGASANKWICAGITLVDNIGTAEVRPVLYFTGAGKLRYIENQTTGKRLWLNLDTIASEEIFIDFGEGRIYSVVRGNLYHTILPGSDFHGFTLIPGENKIAMFVQNDVNASATIFYTPTHWSSDGTQPAEDY